MVAKWCPSHSSLDAGLQVIEVEQTSERTSRETGQGERDRTSDGEGEEVLDRGIVSSASRPLLLGPPVL